MNSYYTAVQVLLAGVLRLMVALLAAGLASCSRPPEHSGVPAMSAVAIAPVAEAPAVTVTAKGRPAVVPARPVSSPAATAPAAPRPASTPAVPSRPGATRTQAGRVLDESGQPLVGATVILRGSTYGTSTDATGSYMLQVPKGENTFVIGYAGYEDETASSYDGQPLTVTLLPSPNTHPSPPAKDRRATARRPVLR